MFRKNRKDSSEQAQTKGRVLKLSKCWQHHVTSAEPGHEAAIAGMARRSCRHPHRLHRSGSVWSCESAQPTQTMQARRRTSGRLHGGSRQLSGSLASIVWSSWFRRASLLALSCAIAVRFLCLPHRYLSDALKTHL